jgi:phage FluMu protein gp41
MFADTPRLTTLAAVEAYLHEIAAHQSFDATNHTGRYAYMFGAAMVLISQAHSQIERLERRIAAMEANHATAV